MYTNSVSLGLIQYESNSKNSICRRTKQFYELPVEELIDDKMGFLPLIEEDEIALTVLVLFKDYDHVWVVENLKNKKLMGVITEHDFLYNLIPRRSVPFFGVITEKTTYLDLNEKVELIMQYNPVVCMRDESLNDVLKKMNRHNCRRLPVVRSKTLEMIGEITLHKIIGKYYDFVIEPSFQSRGIKKREVLRRKKHESGHRSY